MAQLIEIKKIEVTARALTARVTLSPDAPLMTSEDIEGTARIYQLLPHIIDHVCLGDSHETFKEVMGNTEVAHLLEHVTVELLAQTDIAGDISTGRTYDVEGDERSFDIVLSCPDDVLVAGALASGIWLLQWAYTGGGEPAPDVEATVAGLVGLVQSLPEPPAQEVEEGALLESFDEIPEQEDFVEEAAPFAEEAVYTPEAAGEFEPVAAPVLEPEDEPEPEPALPSFMNNPFADASAEEVVEEAAAVEAAEQIAEVEEPAAEEVAEEPAVEETVAPEPEVAVEPEAEPEAEPLPLAEELPVEEVAPDPIEEPVAEQVVEPVVEEPAPVAEPAPAAEPEPVMPELEPAPAAPAPEPAVLTPEPEPVSAPAQDPEEEAPASDPGATQITPALFDQREFGEDIPVPHTIR